MFPGGAPFPGAPFPGALPGVRLPAPLPGAVIPPAGPPITIVAPSRASGTSPEPEYRSP